MKQREYLKSRMRDALERLEIATSTEFDDEEVGAVVRDVVALWERSLKKVEDSWKSKTLYEIIGVLRSGEVSDAFCDALDYLRRAANRDKHEMSPVHRVEEVFSAVTAVGDAIDDVAAVFARLDFRASGLRKRRFFVTVYDYYVGGESELWLFPPNVAPPRFYNQEIDVFQIMGSRLDELVSTLRKEWVWEWNPKQYAALVRQYNRESSDFYKAALFEGSYPGLIKVMGSFQHDLNLLPGLHRSDHWHAVRAALCMSLVDASDSGMHPFSDTGLLAIASTQYGVDIGRPRVRQMADKVAALGRAAISAGVDALDGPRWCSGELWHRRERGAVAGDRQLRLSVNSDGTVWVGDPPSDRRQKW